jgi:hypothetical protein
MEHCGGHEPAAFLKNLSSPDLALSKLACRWPSGGGKEHAFELYPLHRCRVPHTPDFLWSFVGSLNFMRLSLKKGAHAVLSRAAYRKFGASRSFFARCGIPQVSPSSLLRVSQLHTGAPRSHQRCPDFLPRSTSRDRVCGFLNATNLDRKSSVRGTKTMGEAPQPPFVPDPTLCSLGRPGFLLANGSK